MFDDSYALQGNLCSFLYYCIVLFFFLSFFLLSCIECLICLMLLQEIFRYAMYLLLRKTEAGLKEISENHEIGSNKLEMAYVSGLGFGAMSGAFALVNVLADSVSLD